MKRRRRFTRPQALFLLAVVNTGLVIAGSMLLARYHGSDGRDVYASPDSLVQPATAGNASYYAVETRKTEAFEFDPNEADSTQLLRLGLAPFQVRSIYRYRAKGGRYSTPDDFRRVYRLTNEQWEHLSPLIRISRRYRLVPLAPSGDERLTASSRVGVPRAEGSVASASKATSSDTAASAPVDGLSSMPDTMFSATTRRAPEKYPRKLSDNETVDLNHADSALLCRVPGIGPYFARRIVEYRRRLGGYVEVEQLLQIDNFPADAIAWLEVTDSTGVSRLKVNSLSTRQLMKHPYMGYYRASEIAAHRRIYGRVAGPEALKSMPHFTEEDIRRLLPYLDFE